MQHCKRKAMHRVTSWTCIASAQGVEVCSSGPDDAVLPCHCNLEAVKPGSSSSSSTAQRSFAAGVALL